LCGGGFASGAVAASLEGRWLYCIGMSQFVVRAGLCVLPEPLALPRTQFGGGPPTFTPDRNRYGSPCFKVYVHVVNKHTLAPVGCITGQDTSDEIKEVVENACRIEARGRPWRCLEGELTKSKEKPCDAIIRFEFKNLKK
jgi:hypothetical protein